LAGDLHLRVKQAHTLEVHEGRVRAQRQGGKPRRGKRSGEYRSRVGSNIHRVETDSQSEQHSEVAGPSPLDVASRGLLTSRYCPFGHCASMPCWWFQPLAGVALVDFGQPRAKPADVGRQPGSAADERASAELGRRSKDAAEDGGDGVKRLAWRYRSWSKRQERNECCKAQRLTERGTL
jgi:hypothetical protein